MYIFVDFANPMVLVFLINTTFQIGKSNNFGDGYSVNQRWYIEQTTPNQGYLEVKIWTKVRKKCIYYSYAICYSIICNQA